jgi:RNA polymerase sigma-70 factor (ECF subfamily)
MGGDDRSKSLPDAPATEDPTTPALVPSVSTSVEATSRRGPDAPPPRPLQAVPADAARFQRLFQEHERVVLALARKLCRSQFDADDLTQDVFERALRHLHRLTPGTSERAWLCTITRNLFIDRVRRRRTTPQPGDGQAANDTAAPVADEPPPPWRTLEPEQLRRAVERLGHKLREVYVMHAFEGIDYTTIAARLAIPKATVGTRLMLARQKLRQLLLAESGVEA